MAEVERILTGDLATIYVPKILNLMMSAEKTGVLTLSYAERQVQIHFDRGAVAYVSSSFMPGLGLADFLVARKLLSEEQMQQAADKAMEDGAKLGIYLVEKGIISSHDLFETLNLQVKAKLFRAFTWVEGEYVFREGEIVEQQARNLSINLPNVIYEGLRSYVPMKKLPTEFKGRNDDSLFRLYPKTPDINQIKLKPKDARMLKVIDDKRTLRQIVSLVVQDKAEKKEAYKGLYGLFVLGFIGFKENAAATRRLNTRPRPAAKKKPAPAQEGYEIKLPKELIESAVESVERIKQEVAQDPYAAAGDDLMIETAPLEIPDDPGERDETTETDLEPINLDAKPEPQTGQQTEPLDVEGFDLTDGADSDFSIDSESATNLIPDGDLTLEHEGGTGFAQQDKQTSGVHLESFADISDEQPASSDRLSMEGSEEQRANYVAEAHDRDALPESKAEIIKQALFSIEQYSFRQALELLDRISEEEKDDSEVVAIRGWALFNDQGESPDAFREAEAMLRNVIKADPKNWRAFLFLGKMYKSKKELDFAELHLVRALEINNECVEAKELIRSLYS